MQGSSSDMQEIFARAVARSKAIGDILVERDALRQIAKQYMRFHGRKPALIIADDNTWRAAGSRAESELRRAGLEVQSHILPAVPRPKPSVDLGNSLAGLMDGNDFAPVAVGSGVINDLVKYAAHRRDRSYSCVATAASMDGYSSAGSPLSDQGFKMTIQCRPPVAILADLDVIAAAPKQMAGWGYGDMAGKIAAGGDWLLADALGIEPLDDVAWPLVQDNLRAWLAAPDAVAGGDPAALSDLFIGLTTVGLAMEFHGSSRPASGADHQIAHIWEMEHLSHDGEVVAHGACVAIGTLTALALYDWLLRRDFSDQDVDRALAAALTMDEKRRAIQAHFGEGQIAARAVEETEAKHVEGEALEARLHRLVACWPDLRRRLIDHLIPRNEMRDLLARAGAPVDSTRIGVSREHLSATTLAAGFLRSRYTVLDTLAEFGLLHQAVDEIFAADAKMEARG